MKKNNHVVPAEDPTSIGNILVEMGLLNQEQLVELVAKFREKHDELLGEFIVRNAPGITEEHVELALIRQQSLRGNGRISRETVARSFTLSSTVQQNLVGNITEFAGFARSIAKINGR